MKREPKGYIMVRYAGQKWRLTIVKGNYGWIERGPLGQWAHVRTLTKVMT